MRPVDIASVAICLVIVAAVFFAFWKHGRGNPQSTGQLAREIKKHGDAIQSLQTGLGSCATRGSVDLLAEQVRNLEAHSASSGEVIAIEAKINGLRETLLAQIQGVASAAERTEQGVRRIESYFLQKGVNGQ